MGIIYKITNKQNQKIYIGQTRRTLQRRWLRHLADSRLQPPPMLISRAIAKYGESEFTIETLAVVPDSELDAAEQNAIACAHSNETSVGYNISPGGKCSKFEKTQQHNQVQRKTRTPRKITIDEIERRRLTIARRRESGYVSPLKGKSRHRDIGIKISKALKGRTFSSSTLEKIKQSRLGKKASEETRKKQSDAHKNKTVSQETKNRQAAAAKLAWAERLADPTWVHWRVKRKLETCAIIEA